ncbi:hypothetical protein OsI_31230 [Oryza sativa Indica Group]|uniref:Uncharacterized protein n=1 Tax=Oryza sativa subsp. indica TaxID=39946 RepID=A2Z0V2_ORYSI|nr:hypothetical protein OsI_31230 [Oryza sativa Indica Group]
MEASSIARVAQSLKQIAQNRPATKLLDSESLPKLDAPAAPFQRLGKPLKHPVSPSSDEHEKKRPRNKTKRPLPGKKWRKANSIKESSLDGKSRYNFRYGQPPISYTQFNKCTFVFTKHMGLRRS